MKAKALIAAIALTISANAMADQLQITPKQLAAVKAVVSGQLKDPESARYRNVRNSTRAAAVCGEVNAKNSMGGYTGFTRFVLSLDGPVVTMDIESQILDFQKEWFAACSTPEEDQVRKELDAQHEELCRDLASRGTVLLTCKHIAPPQSVRSRLAQQEPCGSECQAARQSIANDLALVASDVHAAEMPVQDPAEFEAEMRRIVGTKLRDPASAQYQNLRQYAGHGEKPVFCGEVNAKNAYGGYTGFRTFIVNANTNTVMVMPELTPASDLTDVIFAKTYVEQYAELCK